MQKTVDKIEILKNIVPFVSEACRKLDLIPVEIDFKNESGRWYLKIFIFSENHTVTHNECEALTKSISDTLDEMIAVQYYLEVSSPGIDRKLKSTQEYNIFKNHNVIIKLKNSSEFELKNFKAKLTAFDEEIGLTVFVPDLEKEIILQVNDISSVRLDSALV
jgi:ribosome maturation factor RimP